MRLEVAGVLAEVVGGRVFNQLLPALVLVQAQWVVVVREQQMTVNLVNLVQDNHQLNQVYLVV
jgi:hypothetical protein